VPLGLPLLIATGLILFGLIQWRMLGWQHWAVIASGALLVMCTIAGFGIVEKRKYRLEQVKFLTSLAENFSSHQRMFDDAWRVLMKYDKVPEEMDNEEWNKVIGALRNCYKSVALLFKIAQLAKNQTVDRDLLYIFYYDEIIGYWTFKLRFLIKWCGTGLDLAANYDSYEIARMVKGIRELVTGLNTIHERHGGSLVGHKELMANFEESTGEFLADPSIFAVGSDNYVGNYVSVREWR